MRIIKRDGRIEEGDKNKIKKAITKSTNGIYDKFSKEELSTVAEKCYTSILNKFRNQDVEVEIIHEEVINFLMMYSNGRYRELAANYREYNNERNMIRLKNTSLMKAVKLIGVETDRDNANVGNNFSSKLLRIASECNKCNVLFYMPKRLAKLHEMGDLYYHDLDSYNLTTNCLHNPLGKLLENGFNTGYGDINRPKRIETAGHLACIVLQSNQNNVIVPVESNL